MKRILNGVRYDTDKGIEIGSFSHGCYPGSGDFSHWNATLYRTQKSGRYFLAGEGGGMTQFAEHFPDGMRGGGSKLIPLDKGEALAWAERYLDTDAIEEHFGDMVVDA